MSSLPYIIGSERAIVESLLELLGSSGTLMMPSQNSYDNGDPKFWSMPPVEQSLHPKLRENFLPFDFFTPLKRFLLSKAGSKSTKLTFGFSSKHASSNVFWKLG